jgi:Tol biopolymer transport system component
MRISRPLIVLGAALAAAAHTSLRSAEPIRLTHIVNSYPAGSPDGSTIVFQSNRTGRFQIYTMNIDGGAVRQLTDREGDNGGPSYSPDGQHILFASWRDAANGGGCDVYVMSADGGNVRRLTQDGMDNSHPHWSADGARIIFNSSRTTPAADRTDPKKEQDDIFSMRPDGSDLQQLTHCNTICTYAHYSPDMKKIVYRKVTNTPGLNWDLSEAKRNSEVFVANADGSGEVNITNHAAFDGWPVWSPDGNSIAFASNRSGPENHGQIYIVKPDGTGLRRLSTLPGSYVQPAWSFDSKRIYAYSNTEIGDLEWGDLVAFDVATP